MVNAQNWLDEKYPNKEEVTKIDSKKEGLEREALEGELVLEGFPNLETVDLSEGKGITKLTIKNCPNIYYINVNDNLISEIIGHEELKDLQWLWISDNKITDPNIVAKNEKLFIFACARNPIKGGEINGRLLNKLIFLSSGIGEENKIFYSVEKDYGEKMKELAKELGIKDEELEGKPVSEIEKLVKDKASEVKKGNELNKGGLDKIEESFPGLVSDGKIADTKLKEIEDKVKKGDELDKMGLTIENVRELQRLAKLVGNPELIAKIEKPVK